MVVGTTTTKATICATAAAAVGSQSMIAAVVASALTDVLVRCEVSLLATTPSKFTLTVRSTAVVKVSSFVRSANILGWLHNAKI